MKASEHVYRQVAEHCSSYTAENGARTTTTNSTSATSTNSTAGDSYHVTNSTCGCEPISCTNCAHFDSKEHCVLDLYDKIVAKHNF